MAGALQPLADLLEGLRQRPGQLLEDLCATGGATKDCNGRLDDVSIWTVRCRAIC